MKQRPASAQPPIDKASEPDPATPLSYSTYRGNDATMTVDVVPYITSINRAAAPFVVRSALGIYPVREGESLTVSGYNFASGSSVELYNRGMTNSVALGMTFVNDMTLTVAVDQQNSGVLVISTNGQDSINHLNDDTATSLDGVSYNREDDGSNAKVLQYDNRYLAVWDVDDTEDGNDNFFADSIDAEHPSMTARGSDGDLVAAWSNYANSTTAYQRLGATDTVISSCFDPPEYTDIDYDGANVAIAVLNNYYGNGGTDWETDYRNGEIAIYTTNAYTSGSWWLIYPFNTRGYQLERLGYDRRLFQFQNPRIKKDGILLHIVYHDEFTKTMKYFCEDDDGNQTWSTSTTRGTDAIEGAAVVLDGQDDQGNDGVVNQSTSNVGLYSAIDINAAGQPRVMYYDISNQTLKLARFTNATVSQATLNNGANWTVQNVFQGTDVNSLYTGQYVSMKVDSTGNVHASFFRNSTGDLQYISGSTGGTDLGSASILIDEEGSVGKWTDLDLDAANNPVISYLNNAATGTFEGVKFAAYDNSPFSTTDDMWDYMTVPMVNSVEETRTSANVDPTSTVAPWQNGDGSASYSYAVGFNSSDYYYAAQMRKEP
jgi:hypothetical protein